MCSIFRGCNIADKHGSEIQEGDTVFTKIRGGKREGVVEAIVHDPEEAKKVEGVEVKNPPKVGELPFSPLILGWEGGCMGRVWVRADSPIISWNNET